MSKINDLPNLPNIGKDNFLPRIKWGFITKARKFILLTFVAASIFFASLMYVSALKETQSLFFILSAVSLLLFVGYIILYQMMTTRLERNYVRTIMIPYFKKNKGVDIHSFDAHNLINGGVGYITVEGTSSPYVLRNNISDLCVYVSRVDDIKALYENENIDSDNPRVYVASLFQSSRSQIVSIPENKNITAVTSDGITDYL